jgi:hypothetical protein
MRTDAHMADPDGFTRPGSPRTRACSDEESNDLDARLVLLLANQVGDADVLLACIAEARASRSPGRVTALSLLFVGVLLGMQHATEADHLAAVATLATRRARSATPGPGAAWGRRPHADAARFRRRSAAARPGDLAGLEHALETAVGVMLVLLGADVLRRLVRDRIHFHVHRHGRGQPVHVHAHSHRDDGPHAQSAHRHAHPRRCRCARSRSA